MKVIILGKNGQLGHELMDAATRLGATACGFTHRELDVVNIPLLIKTLRRYKPDVLINATAYHQPAECELHPDRALAINAAAVSKMAKIADQLHIRFVTFSSDYVFDGKKGKPYAETDTPNPLQAYGISKFAGELLTLSQSPRSVILRTCGVYGGRFGSRSKKGNFVLTILRESAGKKKLDVSSEQIVSPTYAYDLAEGTMALVRKNPEGGIYHLVNEGFCSWAEMAAEITKVKKIACRIIPVNRGGQSGGIPRPLFSALTNRKAKKLGVVLPDWRDGVKRYLDTLPGKAESVKIAAKKV